MRIALVYPYFLYDRVHQENIDPLPMGMYSIAAVLRENGHEVGLHNWHQVWREPQTVRETLLREQPDVLGVSIFHGNRWGGLDVAELARELLPRTTIVFGGVGATFLWRLLLERFHCIDAIVLGEGETTFLELVQTLERGGRDDLEAVPGLALRANGRAFCTAERPYIRELDSLPIPARHFSYQHLSLTRGCPGACSFCGSPRFWQRRVRSHSPARFVEEMRLLKDRGETFFYVSDDTFTVNRKRVIEVCQRLEDAKLGVQWAAISKVTAVDPEMLRAMRRAGCIQISYGVEHGSPDIRRRLGKEQSDEDIRQAFAWTTAAGILSRAYFIYGCPGETWDDVEQSWRLIRDIKPLACLFYILSLFPGTALYEDFKARTGTTDDIWLERNEDIFYFETDPELDQETVVDYGMHLKRRYFEHLPSFAMKVQLDEDPDLAPLQADFLSRLGMTFIVGDYARNEAVPERQSTALCLFNRALSLAPDARAHWGKGLVMQKKGRLEDASEAFDLALGGFPRSMELRLAQAQCLAALGRPAEAREVLKPVRHEAQAGEMLRRLGG